MIANKVSLSEYKRIVTANNPGGTGLARQSKNNKFNVSSKDDRTWDGFFRGRTQKITFDSKKEMRRFIELNFYAEYLYPNSELFLQERFLIGTDPVTYYVADFYYYDATKNKWVVEDAKGVRTEIFKRKKRLFQQKYPNIEFLEV